jgi:hypothetical protein
MNASIYGANIKIPLKIVCVALIGATLIAMMGIRAHIGA